MPSEVLESPAYKALSGKSVKALLEFFRKVRTDHIVDRFEDTFYFSFAEAKRKGFSSSAFERCLAQLIEVGFIDVVESGGLRGTADVAKVMTTYRLSKRWKDYGTASFEERPRWFREKVHGET